MANSAFHKRQAEGLIVKYNQVKDSPYSSRDSRLELLSIAQVHATLATVQDMEEE